MRIPHGQKMPHRECLNILLLPDISQSCRTFSILSIISNIYSIKTIILLELKEHVSHLISTFGQLVLNTFIGLLILLNDFNGLFIGDLLVCNVLSLISMNICMKQY